MAKFSDLKERITILQTCEMLGIQLNNEQRAPCPICKEGGQRAFRAFPETNTFWCYSHKKSGDIVGLVSAVLKCDVPTAGRKLEERFNIEAPRTTPKFDVDEWGKGLNPSHEAIEGMGIHAKVISAFGGGYNASKPSLKGLLCLPVRDPAGGKLGYVGIAPDTLAVSYPNGFTHPPLFNADKVGPGLLHVVGHPMDVLRYIDSGNDELANVIAILAPLTVEVLGALTTLGREREVTTFEFHD